MRTSKGPVREAISDSRVTRRKGLLKLVIGHTSKTGVIPGSSQALVELDLRTSDSNSLSKIELDSECEARRSSDEREHAKAGSNTVRRVSPRATSLRGQPAQAIAINSPLR